MFLTALAKNADIIAASMGAVAVFGMFVVLCWPYLAPNPYRDRLHRIANDSARNRGPAGAQGDTRLTTRPKQIFKDIVDWMNLADQAEDGEVVRKLRMAGYRGQGPVVTFLAIRLLAAPAIFALAAIYVFVILPLDYPVFFKLAMVTAASLLGYFIPALYVHNRIAKRQKAVRHTWPDALDLVLICVEAGMGIERAFQKVSREIGVQSAVLADELGLTTAELSYLPERRKAYENLAMRTGLESVRAVVTTLIQAEKFGTALGPALRVLAQENRQARMHEAEKKAATLPPKLTVPLIIFFLPILFAVIIAPAVIQISSTL
ncbi:MAG: type II secretion system F family protein [Rhodospirillales bacterium]|nr:type II secretion system F family protein [Rhodospirillales bacterium]